MVEVSNTIMNKKTNILNLLNQGRDQVAHQETQTGFVG